jgi:hypothetical protein
LKKKPLTKESTLTINNANTEDQGIYKCRSTTGILEDETTFNIIVDKKGLQFYTKFSQRSKLNLNLFFKHQLQSVQLLTSKNFI